MYFNFAVHMGELIAVRILSRNRCKESNEHQRARVVPKECQHYKHYVLRRILADTYDTSGELESGCAISNIPCTQSLALTCHA